MTFAPGLSVRGRAEGASYRDAFSSHHQGSLHGPSSYAKEPRSASLPDGHVNTHPVLRPLEAVQMYEQGDEWEQTV